MAYVKESDKKFKLAMIFLIISTVINFALLLILLIIVGQEGMGRGVLFVIFVIESGLFFFLLFKMKDGSEVALITFLVLVAIKFVLLLTYRMLTFESILGFVLPIFVIVNAKKGLNALSFERYIRKKKKKDELKKQQEEQEREKLKQEIKAELEKETEGNSDN